ncbi:MAG TPA: DCC1-like thiol-disulfide oxidoreductase family protein, partial [Candidatus Eisenbacteria bacterium]
MKSAVPDTHYPPLIGAQDRVILFDGVCNLCNGTVQFILQHDRKRVFRLAAIQSPAGQALMDWFGFMPGSLATLILVEGNRASTRSTAVLRIANQLPWP